MKFTSEQIKKAWAIRKESAKKFACRVIEISWSVCLSMAKNGDDEIADLIEKVEWIVGDRIKNPANDGKWLVWDCYRGVSTMDKFVERVKREVGRPTFVRKGRFGILIGE